MLLTIAIPSHNATHYLHEAIRSIITEPEFGRAVNISISDNSISNSSTELIQKYYRNYSAIRHHRSTEYSSLDANVNRSVELASGTYVWIFGDDDLIVPGALSKLVSFLEEKKPELLVVNSQSFHDSRIIETSRVSPDVKPIYGLDQSNDFLRDLGSYLTYVGGIVVRRDLWLEHYDHTAIGSYFAHIKAVCSIKLECRAHFFAHPSIRMRMHSQTWTSKTFLIWNCHYPDLIWSLPDYSDSAKQSVIPRCPIHSPRRMLASRAYGSLHLNSWRVVIFPSHSVNFIFKIYTFLLCMFPRLLFRQLYISFLICFRNRHTRVFSPALALSQLRYTRS